MLPSTTPCTFVSNKSHATSLKRRQGLNCLPELIHSIPAASWDRARCPCPGQGCGTRRALRSLPAKPVWDSLVFALYMAFLFLISSQTDSFHENLQTSIPLCLSILTKKGDEVGKRIKGMTGEISLHLNINSFGRGAVSNAAAG